MICTCMHAGGTSAGSVSTFDVSEYQLSTRLTDRDYAIIAAYFDDFEDYIHMFNLENHQKADARRKGRDKNILGVTEILICWIQCNGSAATFKELVNILSQLRKHEVAERVCTYVKENIPGCKQL